jgi:hypothetical protein
MLLAATATCCCFRSVGNRCISGEALQKRAVKSKGLSYQLVTCSVIAVCHASFITRLRGDALTAINGTSLLDIRGEGEVPHAVPSSGVRESGRRLHQEALRSLIVGPEGCGLLILFLALMWGQSGGYFYSSAGTRVRLTFKRPHDNSM